MSDETFIGRWSRRKRQAKAGEAIAPGVSATSVAAAQAAAFPQAREDEPRPAGRPPDPQDALTTPPPIESVTPESDIAPFMKPEVDEGLRRQALKAIFQDPHFNVMDGLDVYIDDFSKADPIPDGWLEKMNQVAHLGEYLKPAEASPEKPAAEDPVRKAEQPSEDLPATAAEGAPSDTGDAPSTGTPVRES